MKTRKECDEERRRYCADVEYEVWCAGGDFDRVSHDRIEDNYYANAGVDAAARQELKRQRLQRQKQEQYQDDEQGEEQEL